MAKIQIKSEKLTPFGGIFHVMDLLERHLSHIIDGTLGKRSVSIGCDYSEIIRSLMCVYFWRLMRRGCFQPSYGTSELASFIAHL